MNCSTEAKNCSGTTSFTQKTSLSRSINHLLLNKFQPRSLNFITPKDIQIPVEVIFQSIETLHQSCPNNLGDWYFTGNYPTAGGNRVVNRAFMNYMEGKNVRGY
jgi:hypothetical protein